MSYWQIIETQNFTLCWFLTYFIYKYKEEHIPSLKNDIEIVFLSIQWLVKPSLKTCSINIAERRSGWA